ncbi:conserved hypothetical protein [Haloferula helveola]|uniref:DUF4331 domain-containing protein n=1 Tax=Haloferula helveola TaxID=490095 RepID=A0ABM7RB63_9BACT|nr:conserved hypothetical protein [Haloferula helveola]
MNTKRLELNPSRKLRPVRYAGALLALTGFAAASSHSDAPLIKQDPQANLTDVYAFIGTKYDEPSTEVLNVIVSVRPFSDPGDGLIYDRFADDARYSIHITDPVTGEETMRYDFEFSSVTDGIKNPDTILSYGLGTAAGPIGMIGDAQQNYTQTYSVIEEKPSEARARRRGFFGFFSFFGQRGGRVQMNLLGDDLPVAPPNVGPRTTPAYNGEDGLAVSGATSEMELDSLTAQAVSELSNGVVAWAGPREDGFFADTPGIFDLLDPRIIDNDGDGMDGLGQDGGGVDGFKGFNVLSYGIQIPLSELEPAAFANPFLGAQTGVGVYASVSRKRVTLISDDGAPRSSGPWVQVNRLANPLFNEVLVPLRDKDNYNRTEPENDDDYRTYAENSELAFLINFVLFEDPTGQAPLVTSGRADLAAVYIPDVIRVDTTTGPVLLPGQDGFNRLSVLGGDAGGWPNGRRPGDDVVDIALSAVASGPDYTDENIVVGDNVPKNDQLYNQVFPYLGTPHAGPTVSQRQTPMPEN